MKMTNNKIKVAGRFYASIIRDGKVIHKDEIGSPNIVVNEGRNHMLATEFAGGTPVGTWYIGIFTGSQVDTDATYTAANITANTTETEAYAEGGRVEWVEAADGANVKMDNSASPATFTANASITVRGAFLISNSTKSATTGFLMSYANFGTARSLINLDELVITYEIAATST